MASEPGKGETKDVISVDSAHEVASSSHTGSEETERKARVDAAWEQMNKGVTMKTTKPVSSRPGLTITKTTKTTKDSSTRLMSYLGLGQKKTLRPFENTKQPSILQNGSSDEAKKFAAAALSAVKDAAALSGTSGQGKIEIKEVRDFAGKDIEIKKLVDAESKEAWEKAKAPAGTPSAVDAVLEQIKKKQKLSVLDKTKKDWGEFKDEHKGLENELDAYKKSSNQYLDKQSFLQRADYREFERERDVRLSMQSKRKPDMREDP